MNARTMKTFGLICDVYPLVKCEVGSIGCKRLEILWEKHTGNKAGLWKTGATLPEKFETRYGHQFIRR